MNSIEMNGRLVFGEKTRFVINGKAVDGFIERDVPGNWDVWNGDKWIPYPEERGIWE